MTLRVSEVYLSVQGEGPRAGAPTIFVRFAGCNLRCPLWPCDTQHAIDPEKYRNEWLKMTPQELADKITEVDGGRKVNICFTGGEPFLQPKGDLEQLVVKLRYQGFSTFEAFTNGTLLYPAWALDQIFFIMDWKLPGSGEDHLNKNRLANLAKLTEADAIKFVIADALDFGTAEALWGKYVVDGELPVMTYYGAAWGKIENSKIIDWVLEAHLPWLLNVQVHNYIWNREERAR